MALQDQTLANTMAKVGMEAKRRRNIEVALAAMQPGVRQRGELPWWANVPTGPSMYGTPAAPGWLQAASDWFRDPGYSREAVVPGGALVDYARTVAEGGQPGAMQTVAAGLDLPLPGLSAAEAGLAGLGAAFAGITRGAKAKRPVTRLRGVHYSRKPGLTEIDPARAGGGLDALRRAQEARAGSTRPSEAFFYTEGSELAGKPEVGLGPHEYRTVDELEVYDFGKDPLGLKEAQREAWRKKYAGKPYMGEMPENEAAEGALNELIRMGYKGYTDPGTGITAMFEKVPVRPAETGPRAWLENVATVADLPMEPQPGTRGAEYLRAFERRKVKGKTQFIGAPPGVQSPRDIENLVEKYASNIEAALDAGVPEGYFYREGTRAIEEVTESPEAASALARGIAVTSSEAPVQSNVDWAVRGLEQRAMGQPVHTGYYPGQMAPPYEAVLRGESPELGVKRGRYGAGLYGGTAGGRDVLAPNDRWEARTVGFDVEQGGISPLNARFIDRVRQEAIGRVNERRGLSLRPLEGQELNWITERTRGTSSAGAMAVPTVDYPTATIQGGLASRAFQHSWETAPGEAAQHLRGMSPAQSEAYRVDMERQMIDPATGKDVLISAMGGQMQMPAFRGPGVWKGEVTPGVQSRSIVSATSKGLDPASAARVEGTEAVRALALGQEGYAGSMLTPGSAGAKDMLSTNLGGTVDPDTALRVQSALDTEFGAGKTTVVPTEQGFNILKTGDVPRFSQRIAQFGKQANLGPLTGVPEVQSVRGQYGPTSLYGELPWEQGQATTSVLGTLEQTPGLVTRAESGETRQLMGKVADVYDRMRDQGIMPNEKLVDVLRTWQKEGLAGVRRLVEAGVAPAVVLTLLSREEGSEQTSGGLTGGPAGSGLPELGV